MKRTTKQQREVEEIQAIYNRLRDIADGASGGSHGVAFESDCFAGMASELGLEAFGRWLGGIRDAFSLREPDNAFMFEPHCLHHFDSLKSAAEFLHESKVKA